MTIQDKETLAKDDFNQIGAPYKLGIVGAGQVGSAIAYASMIRHSAREIALYDINEKVADAQVSDLAHGTMFTQSKISGGGDINVLADSDIVIITAGVAQKPGQTRLELAGVNAGIVKSLMEQLVPICPEGIFVIITNPCDLLTVVAQRVSGLPNRRIFSTGTMLDTSRLRYLIAQYAHVSTSNAHVQVIGEHGDSEFVPWSNARIGGLPIRDWQVDGEKIFTDQTLAKISTDVAQAAYHVIEGKGSTNYAIGLSASYLVESILANSHQIMPVSGVLDNYYGVSDVALSVPRLITRRGMGDPIEIPMSDDEIAKLHASADQIRQTLNSIGY